MKNIQKFPNINLMSYNIGEMEDMKIFDDEKFDIVLTSHVLCSVSDIKKSLEECYRILKKVKLILKNKSLIYN